MEFFYGKHRKFILNSIKMTHTKSKLDRKYGHIKSKIDDKDPKVKFDLEHVKAFNAGVLPIKPIVFDLRKVIQSKAGSLLTTINSQLNALTLIDQGMLGSCTANAISFAYAIDEISQHNKETFLPSRLFIYYNERTMEGTVDQDAGAQIKDGISSLNLYGVCDEHYWIYDPVKFAVKPPTTAYTQAKKIGQVAYAAIDFSADKTINDRVNHLKLALQSGFPVVFGFIVYDSFESDQVAATGMVPVPTDFDNVMGGHAVCTIGFDDDKKCFIVKNSWGPNWGVNGYFYMPYQYIGDPNLVSDFWILKTVANAEITGWTAADIKPYATNLNVNPSDNGGVVNSFSN